MKSACAANLAEKAETLSTGQQMVNNYALSD